MRKFFLFVLLALIGSGFYAYHLYEKALDEPFSVSAETVFVVNKGMNIRQVAEALHQKGLMKNHWALTLYAYESNQAHKIKAGSYGIFNKTPKALLNDLVKGNGLRDKITIIEGKRFSDLWDLIQKNKNIVQTVNSPEELKQLLKLEYLEGQFLPDTYVFDYGIKDIDLYQKMHQSLKTYLQKEWDNRSPDLPLKSPEEALILASLIEKETGVADERAEISGVFIRRLEKKMRLQTDPSVIYGAKDYNGVITKTHLQTDTPYNTYTRHGLPPTPIALAGRASIEASLNPADGETLFFVANGTGGHTFSVTYEEHLKAVAEYRALMKRPKGETKTE